jgi:hypothetical protein
MVQLLDAMQSAPDGVTYYLNRKTGVVDYRVEGDDFGADEGGDDEPDFFDETTWLEVPTLSSREGYHLMASFAETIDEPDIRRLLDTALDGRGAFRRFREVVDQYPDVKARWRSFEREYLEREAIDWLGSVGIEPEYTLPSIPIPEPPAAVEARDKLELIDLLIFGAPDGKTEVIEGKVTRVYLAGSESEARKCFKDLAREICGVCGVGWRKRFVQGVSTFEMDRYGLSVEGARVELLVDVHSSVTKRFYRG